MLTVNSKSKDGSNEVVYEALMVTGEASPERPVSPVQGEYDFVIVMLPDGQSKTISGRDVFVMNSDGKTIAKYILPAEEKVESGQINA